MGNCGRRKKIVFGIVTVALLCVVYIHSLPIDTVKRDIPSVLLPDDKINMMKIDDEKKSFDINPPEPVIQPMADLNKDHDSLNKESKMINEFIKADPLKVQSENKVESLKFVPIEKDKLGIPVDNDNSLKAAPLGIPGDKDNSLKADPVEQNQLAVPVNNEKLNERPEDVVEKDVDFPDHIKEEKPLIKENNVIINSNKDVQFIPDAKVPNIDDGAESIKLAKENLKMLEPPDHLEGVRMEQDGHINTDFKKEIFIGHHDEIEDKPEEEQKTVLKDIFSKCDTNSDGFIDEEELLAWIKLKTAEHFKDAEVDTERVFKIIDHDKDGYFKWEEFHFNFLLLKNVNEEDAKKHIDDYDTVKLNLDDKEEFLQYRFRWSDADLDPQDNKLTVEEFKSFRHPETSPVTLKRMVKDIMINMDMNDNGILEIKEFNSLPYEEDESWKEVDKKWIEMRTITFKAMDANHDGKVTEDELMVYVDPKNLNNVIDDAKDLIRLGDDDKNDKLSLREILENRNLFLGSKLVDTGRSFHDEF